MRPLRLTLLNAGALVLFAVVVLVVVNVARAAALERSLDNDLQTQAEQVNRLNLSSDTEAALAVAVSISAAEYDLPLVYLQAADGSGVVLARSETLGRRLLPVDAERVRRALRGDAWLETVTLDAQPMRLYTAPLWMSVGTGAPRVTGIIEAARVIDPSAGRELGALLIGTIVTALMAVPLALASGAVMTRSALAPLNRFVTTLRAINDAKDLGIRVVLTPQPAYQAIARLAQEFNSMLARLETAAQRVEGVLMAQRRFVADASHELRTPLTSLRGNIDLLRADLDPHVTTEHRAILSDMQAEAARMGRLVNDLLLLADADSGRHLVLEHIDLTVVVQQAVRSARRLRSDVDLRVRNSASPSSVWVCGNRDRLAQVLLILLDNALKFSPPRSLVDLEIDADERDGRPGVTIRVTDRGPGVAPDERELIFERFYRSDRARAGEGAGLGLAIARWIVEEHAGALGVQSAAGGGSTFVLWLPSTTDPTI